MKQSPLHVLALALAILGSVLLFGAWYYHLATKLQALPQTTVTIGTTEVIALLPRTLPEYQLGLGNRPSLPENQGMLFRYTQKQDLSFWMKGMQFPLDFIWIADGIVIDLTENVQPGLENGTYTLYSPKQPADSVLEVNAGFIKAHDIKIGDKVKIKQ